LSSAAASRTGFFHSELIRKVTRWLDAMPHPALALEISPDRIAAARWGRTGSLEGYYIEPLPAGAIVPSAVEVNILNLPVVSPIIASACERLKGRGEDVALILPDPVIRVFVQQFDEFPRSADEAIPMLRWKLKKSVPFEADETVISYMRQDSREEGVNVLTALARLRIIREYESLAETAGFVPGVVLSSSLAAITLLEDEKPALLARISGSALTTAIVRHGTICGYRCTDLPVHSAALSPQMLLEEVFPVAAYFQDTWHENIGSVRVAGLGSRLSEFVQALEEEFHCPVRSLVQSAVSEGRVRTDARPLIDREIDGLVGWMMHGN
jgi:type IV pilus assembly protein PilM